MTSALILLGLLVLFWRVPVFGEVIAPLDVALADPAFRMAAPPEFEATANPLLSDPVRQFLPWHDFVARSFASEGRIPLWNPYSFTGQPLVANAISAVFFPPNLLLLVAGAATVATVRSILLVLLAGIFTHLFARRLGIGESGARIAGVAFAFSGPLTVWLAWPQANVLVFLPFLLWVGEGIASRGLSFRPVALGGLGVGMTILGGHPESTFHVCVAFAAWTLWRSALPGGCGIGRATLAGLCAALLGAALGAVQLLPLLENLLSSATFAWGERSIGGDSVFYSDTWTSNLATAISFVQPTFFGTPVHGNWSPSHARNFNEMAVHFGGVALALALGALARSDRPAFVVQCASFFLLSLAIGWRLPIFEAVNHLPVFSWAINNRFRLFAALFGAILAGAGLDALLMAQARARRMVLFSLGVLILIGTFVVWGDSPTPQALGPLFGAILALILMAGWRQEGNWRARALVAVVLTEGVLLAWGYNPTFPEQRFSPSGPIAEFFSRQGRVVRVLSRNVLVPHLGMPFGVANIGAYDLPVDLKWAELYRRHGAFEAGHRQRWDPEWPLVDALGVEYLLSAEPRVDAGWQLEANWPGVWLYRNTEALSRARIVHRARVDHRHWGNHRRVVGGNLDLRNEVLLERPWPHAEASATVQDPSGRESSSKIVSESSDRVRIAVETGRPGILVLSDLYAPGWRAEIDGRPVELLRANHAFRAVALEPGDRLVEMRYDPLSFRIGLWLTVATLALLLAVALRHWRTRRNEA